MGLVTRNQLERALQKQRELIENRTLPERLQRASIVSKERQTPDEIPLLGQLLTDMGFITKKQLDRALSIQDKEVEAFKNLDREKLITAIGMGSVINSSLNLVKVLTLIMSHANRVTHSEASTLMLLDDRTGELVFSIPTGPKAEQLIDIRLPSGKGIAGWVVKKEVPVLVSDAKTDPRFYPKIDKIRGIETKSILCVPLKAKSKLIGALEVINKTDDTSFCEEDELLLSIFASQAALAIENARLYGELKERWEEQKLMQKRLTESEKFKALGQMASGVAHDFNNILSAIMGYSEIALLNIPQKSPERKNIDQVLKASNRATELVRQILAFSRQSTQELMPVKINHLVKEALNLFRASLPSTIEIHQDITTDDCMVMADATQIHQVLMNLCTNAHYAMRGEEGILRIALTSVELKDDAMTPYPDLQPGAHIKISVSDNGHGIEQQIMERIFDPYFTTKDVGVGTGMGLAVVHGIVKSHGGTITVSSTPGTGTTFKILLPRTNHEFESKMETEEPLPLGKERILFVDDEEILVDLGKEMLEHLGYQLTGCYSSLEALETFQTQPNDFDLVITDMTMPQMTGDQLVTEIQNIRSGVPTILCTGLIDKRTEENATARGISAFLTKPYATRDLANTVRQVLDQG